MIVPHKDRTIDINNPRTTLQHLINDYHNSETELHESHIGHDHCWITEDIIYLIQWMVNDLGLHWTILDIQDQDDKAGNGFTIVLRKDKNNAKITISNNPC